ncbi:exodeoxyribonuclease V subunit gamma [Candidatus Blochmanniella vafra]|nr:exodeoxyribonuclease V subunit gamma [Candidatus Blochmannia vafer]
MVYRSNCIELFMKFVMDIMSRYQLSNPLKPEVMLIENKIIAQWIETELTSYFGVAANITFMNVTAFIQKIAIDFLSDKSKVVINSFCDDSMYWKFMEVLMTSDLNKKCSIIQKYLDFDINQRKLSQFSEQLANLFSEYLIYRPDWLNMWQSNKFIDNLDGKEHQIWQAEIWRMFLNNIEHKSQKFNSVYRCVCFLEKNIKKINWNQLPNRIFIYGITSIPLIYLKILKLLSYHIDIYLCFISPFENNWNWYQHKYDNDLLLERNTYQCHCDILSEFSKNNDMNYHKQYDKNSICMLQLEHPLLNSWGKVGKGALCSLSQLHPLFEIKAFKYPQTDSILHILQRNILEFSNIHLNPEKKSLVFPVEKKFSQKKHILKLLDQSITFHECYSIQREIEVLHDNLLLMLSDDPNLLPGDIIVMAPNIDFYIAEIKTVFNNVFNRKLPFSISANHNNSIHPIISSILSILDISNSRFTAEEILSLLSVSSISSKFHINNEEIELLRLWVIKSGIRWGLDEETMKTLNMPITDQNTWYFGLKRMLLGYAMKSTDSGLWENISPYDCGCINDKYVHIISGLVEFLKILQKWRNRLSYSYTLKTWLLYFKEIINDFFYCNDFNIEENQALLILKTYWINIIESGMKLGYSNTIHISILRDKLIHKLNKKNIYYRFVPNVINFCNINPICLIPCKILCLIGMNVDAYPRSQSIYDFNLIAKKLRCGDNNIRKENDYYAFLLLFLLPKARIYFSFINESIIRSNISNNSSILINELLEYIAQNFCLIGDQNLDIQYNIKRVQKYLFYTHSHMPFNLINFTLNSKTPSFFYEWLHIADTNINSDKSLIDFNFITTLPYITVSTVLLDELYNFYKHPVRVWFQKRLQIYFYQCKYNSILNDEVFSVNSLYKFKINTKLLNYLICEKNTDVLYDELYASGMLPRESFSKLYWINQCNQMNILANNIKEYYLPNKIFTLNICLKYSNITLTGKLSSVQVNGLIRWKPSKLSMKDCFLLWLEHLVYCASGGNGDSRLFGINSIWHFPFFTQKKAKELLQPLILGYCSGINAPLILLYKSGGMWMNNMFDWNNKVIYSNQTAHEKACQKLIQVWQGNIITNEYFSDMKESHDFYLRKLIPFNLNKKHIQIIVDTAKYYFLNMMRYRIL